MYHFFDYTSLDMCRRPLKKCLQLYLSLFFPGKTSLCYCTPDRLQVHFVPANLVYLDELKPCCMKTKFTGIAITAIILSVAVNAQTSWQITGNSNITNNNFIGTINKTAFKIRTDNAVRMTINSLGNIGIGTTTPKFRLDVAGGIKAYSSYFTRQDGAPGISIGRSGANYGSIGYGLTFTDTTDRYRYNISDFSSMLSFTSAGFTFNIAPKGTPGSIISYSPAMTILEKGTVGIGTTDPGGYKLKISFTDDDLAGFGLEKTESQHSWSYWMLWDNLLLYYDGGLRASYDANTGVYAPISDERLKTNIQPMAAMLDKIKQLKPSTYQFKNATTKQEYSGFIAQDVLKIFPNLVTHIAASKRNPDTYTLDYTGFGVIAIKGIQELQPVIEEQKKINEEQKAEIQALKDRLATLESALAHVAALQNSSNTVALERK